MTIVESHGLTLLISIACPTETFTLDKYNCKSEDILVTSSTSPRCDVLVLPLALLPVEVLQNKIF